MTEILGGLKKELFDYLREHPDSNENNIRAAGFGEHLNKLYDGRWIGARLDFKFYQFVETAQKYLELKRGHLHIRED